MSLTILPIAKADAEQLASHVDTTQPQASQHTSWLRMEASCLELALEGERLCKAGDFVTGASFFEAAVDIGTEDAQTLSAIYSQLGSAYYHLGQFSRALTYHTHDLTLARTMSDKVGEAKASGNLGNTLKALGQFDEAIRCCGRQLEISRQLGDEVGEAKALYNLGNVYHCRGKQSDAWGSGELAELTSESSEALHMAVRCYQENLELARRLGDKAAQGRALGNLGNTHYLLGEYSQAVMFHEERLKIAREFGDRCAEKRAYTNLGNTHVRLGEFALAVEHYKKALQLARQLQEVAGEAQACYSLGSTYTLLGEHSRAAEAFLKHLEIARSLHDRVGESRACWSLGNAYTALGEPDQAISFVAEHLHICREVGDRNGELTARLNLTELQGQLGLEGGGQGPEGVCVDAHRPDGDEGSRPAGARHALRRRHEMENLEPIPLTPEKVGKKSNGVQDALPGRSKSLGSRTGARSLLPARFRTRKGRVTGGVPDDCGGSVTRMPPAGGVGTLCNPPKCLGPDSMDDDGFFDLLSRFQGNRMDDQRCELPMSSTFRNSTLHAGSSSQCRVGNQPLITSPQTEDFLELLASSQSRRIDDQRAAMGDLPGLRRIRSAAGSETQESESGPDAHSGMRGQDDDFF
uniref:G-protein-signaling modulator 2-like n=1 Tax=Myxine glutinosa TaxID=7769 RepID=UPI00358F17AF